MDVVTYTERMVAQLRLLDPAASAEVGTPERKLFESAAEVMASAVVDFTMINQQNDVNSMVGARLEAYVGNFGFARGSGSTASGFITLSRATAAPEPLSLNSGILLKAVISQAGDSYATEVRFITTQAATIPAGTTEVTVPIQATVPGEIGNVEAGAITQFAGLNTPANITGITNPFPTSGGTNPEDDIALRLRFKNTLFRNIAGTYDRYLAMAVQAPSVTMANVIGPVSRYYEYVQVPEVADTGQTTMSHDAVTLSYSTGGYDSAGTRWTNKRSTAPSSIPYSKYTYADQHYLTDGNFDPSSSHFFRPYVDYVFNPVPVAATPEAWDFNTLYRLGAIVKNTAGTKLAQVIRAGTSDDDTEPTWPAVGSQVDEGANKPKWKVVATIDKQVYDYSQVGRPNITVLGDSSLPQGMEAGSLLLLEHAYMSESSRNDYGLGIMNAVDIFVNGLASEEASERYVIPNSVNNVQATDPGVWTFNLYGQADPNNNVINWKRKIDGRAARTGNRLMPLYWQPALDAPPTITVQGYTFYRANYYNPADGTYYSEREGQPGSYTYSLKAHYAFVEEVNGLHGSIRARSGVEWFLAAGNPNNHLRGRSSDDTSTAFTGSYIDSTTTDGGRPPLVGSEVTIGPYIYDRNIVDLQTTAESSAAQVTTDVLLHRAKRRYLKLYVTVMYEMGVTQASVDAAIVVAVEALFTRQYFGAAIQLSDILQAIHNVPGVDNVRWQSPHYFTDVLAAKLNSVYHPGDLIAPQPAAANGYYYRVLTTTGDAKSGASFPTWSTNIDGTMTWNHLTLQPLFAVRVEEVNENGESVDSVISGRKFYTDDFYMRDSELPAVPLEGGLDIERRAANTWTEL